MGTGYTQLSKMITYYFDFYTLLRALDGAKASSPNSYLLKLSGDR